jgi:type I restriction enzyme R subunit
MQIREEVGFTKGRIIVRGKLVTRGQAKRADCILYFKPNIPLALIEAKDNSHSVGDGMQQAFDYATTLDIPFMFSSNGDGFVFHARTGASDPREVNLGLDAFPSPAALWARYRAWKGLDAHAEEVVLQDYYADGSGKVPRYYQINAVNAAIEAIAKGRDRVLLVMATGTGKTYTAFQIIWRLWKAGRAKRVLYLADRNVLIDQTMVNDFRPFGGAMAKLSTKSKTIERDDGTSIAVTTAIDSHRRQPESRNDRQGGEVPRPLHEVGRIPARDHQPAHERIGGRNPGPRKACRSHPDQSGVRRRHHVSDQLAGAAQRVLLQARPRQALNRERLRQ